MAQEPLITIATFGNPVRSGYFVVAMLGRRQIKVRPSSSTKFAGRGDLAPLGAERFDGGPKDWIYDPVYGAIDGHALKFRLQVGHDLVSYAGLKIFRLRQIASEPIDPCLRSRAAVAKRTVGTGDFIDITEDVEHCEAGHIRLPLKLLQDSVAARGDLGRVLDVPTCWGASRFAIQP